MEDLKIDGALTNEQLDAVCGGDDVTSAKVQGLLIGNSLGGPAGAIVGQVVGAVIDTLAK